MDTISREEKALPADAKVSMGGEGTASRCQGKHVKRPCKKTSDQALRKRPVLSPFTGTEPGIVTENNLLINGWLDKRRKKIPNELNSVQ